MKRTQHIAYFKVPYREKDNNNYLENDNFCCGDKKSSKDDGITDNEDPELNQFYYHSDHLGSSSYITNLKGSIVQHIEYVPFGEVFLEERNNKWNTPYLFNGKELDEETGLYYYGARYYSGKTSLWLSVDPLWEKYPNQSPYLYCNGNPIIYKDPDGRDGILVVFPDYKVDTESPLGKQPLGHAGVLLINNKTGYTRYYEYGRYRTEDGTKGKVRNVTVSNVVIDSKTGKPTQASLNKVLGQISKASGQNGRIQGAYVEGNFDKMNDYAQGKLNESSDPKHLDYNKDRKPYSLTGNNCGTFSCDVLKQDSEAKKKAPWIFIPTPDNIAKEYQDNLPKVDYNPKTKTTTSDIYKKED